MAGDMGDMWQSGQDNKSTAGRQWKTGGLMKKRERDESIGQMEEGRVKERKEGLR